ATGGVVVAGVRFVLVLGHELARSAQHDQDGRGEDAVSNAHWKTPSGLHCAKARRHDWRLRCCFPANAMPTARAIDKPLNVRELFAVADAACGRLLVFPREKFGGGMVCGSYSGLSAERWRTRRALQAVCSPTGVARPAVRASTHAALRRYARLRRALALP